MKVGKPYTLAVNPIEVRCLYDGIAVTGQLPISLVVGHHQDDVRPRRKRCRDGCRLIGDRGPQDQYDDDGSECKFHGFHWSIVLIQLTWLDDGGKVGDAIFAKWRIRRRIS